MIAPADDDYGARTVLPVPARVGDVITLRRPNGSTMEIRIDYVQGKRVGLVLTTNGTLSVEGVH